MIFSSAVSEGSELNCRKSDREGPNKKYKEELEEEHFKTGLHSVLSKSLYQKSARIRDCLMSIANKCSECQLSNFA